MQNGRDGEFPDEIRFLLKKYSTNPQSLTSEDVMVLRDFLEKGNFSMNGVLRGARPIASSVNQNSGAANNLRDKHIPDEVRILLKKYNTNPQSMTKEDIEVLRDFIEKTNFDINDLRGASPEPSPVDRRQNYGAAECSRKKMFEGQMYDLVLEYDDIQFGYNFDDNPYKKAAELISKHKLCYTLDDTRMKTQLAHTIQRMVHRKRGDENVDEQHLEISFNDEVRVRATAEEKKEFESSVRLSNMMLARNFMEEEARKKSARQKILDDIKLAQMQRKRKEREAHLAKKDGPGDQLSAALYDAERKERLKAAQERQSKSPTVIRRKKSKKRKGVVGFHDLQEKVREASSSEDGKESSTTGSKLQPPREGYFRVPDTEGNKEVPIPDKWDAKLVTAYSWNLFGGDVPKLIKFLRDTVNMDESALTHVEENIASWQEKLSPAMAKQITLQEASALNFSSPDTNELEAALDSSISPRKTAEEAGLVKEKAPEEGTTASLDLKEDTFPSPDEELNIDDSLPKQSGATVQEQKLDIEIDLPQDDVDISDKGAVVSDVLSLDGGVETTVADEDNEKKERADESNADVLMNIDFETDWIWDRPSTAKSNVKTPENQEVSLSIGLEALGSSDQAAAIKVLLEDELGDVIALIKDKLTSKLSSSVSKEKPKEKQAKISKYDAFSGSGHSLVSKENKEAVEEPEAPPGEFSFDSAGEFVTIRFRLASAKVITQKFNIHHTIQDIRNFLDIRHPCGTRLYSLKIQGRPPVLLPRDDVRTVVQAKLNRVCILQRRDLVVF